MSESQDFTQPIPGALRFADMTVGRRVLSIIPSLGMIEEMIVTSIPYLQACKVAAGKTIHESMIMLTEVDTNRETAHFTRELSLLPHDGKYTRFQFLVDPKDADKWSWVTQHQQPHWCDLH